MSNEHPDRLRRRNMANKVSLHLPAPDFTLQDFNGKTVRLSDFRGAKNVVLVFNRGFL